MLSTYRMEVRALSVQMMPALAIDTVCCSIACFIIMKRVYGYRQTRPSVGKRDPHLKLLCPFSPTVIDTRNKEEDGR